MSESLSKVYMSIPNASFIKDKVPITITDGIYILIVIYPHPISVNTNSSTTYGLIKFDSSPTNSM